MSVTIDFQKYNTVIEENDGIAIEGYVSGLIGLTIEGKGPVAPIGTPCCIYSKNAAALPIQTEVVGFSEGKTLLMPLGDISGIAPGDKIVVVKRKARLRVGKAVLGRILDGLGNPIDGKGPIFSEKDCPLFPEPIDPMQRKIITEPLDVGIKAINGVLTIGKGQRVGILAGNGIGKSVLMGMISRNTSADVCVIALIGQRGNEVREFIESGLGKERLKRTIIVAATSDQPPLVRIRAAIVATTIAEYFRDLGKDVVLMMDSISRIAQAQKEVGLAIGGPPATKALTPSVLSLLAKILERAGFAKGKGSITGFYTVLVEGDGLAEPISDLLRSILDGNIILSRDLATQNHYPAIDILNSISRNMINMVSDEQMILADRIIEILATYKKYENIINGGSYVGGKSHKLSLAIEMINSINKFLKQGIFEKVDFQKTIDQMKVILN